MLISKGYVATNILTQFLTIDLLDFHLTGRLTLIFMTTGGMFQRPKLQKSIRFFISRFVAGSTIKILYKDTESSNEELKSYLEDNGHVSTPTTSTLPPTTSTTTTTTATTQSTSTSTTVDVRTTSKKRPFVAPKIEFDIIVKHPTKKSRKGSKPVCESKLDDVCLL